MKLLQKTLVGLALIAAMVVFIPANTTFAKLTLLSSKLTPAYVLVPI